MTMPHAKPDCNGKTYTSVRDQVSHRQAIQRKLVITVNICNEIKFILIDASDKNVKKDYSDKIKITDITCTYYILR